MYVGHTPGFYVSPGDLGVLLTLARQVLHQLSCLPSLSFYSDILTCKCNAVLLQKNFKRTGNIGGNSISPKIHNNEFFINC